MAPKRSGIAGQPTDLLHTEFIRTAKRRWGQLAMADSTGQKLTFGRALVAVTLFAKRIAARTAGEHAVGVLLPASVGGALTNIAVLAAGKLPVNLNFTIGAEAMQGAVAEAGIKTILTSKRFLERRASPRCRAWSSSRTCARAFRDSTRSARSCPLD